MANTNDTVNDTAKYDVLLHDADGDKNDESSDSHSTEECASGESSDSHSTEECASGESSDSHSTEECASDESEVIIETSSRLYVIELGLLLI